jgi:hypothetical protein
MNRWKKALGAGQPGAFFLSVVSVVLLVCVFLIVLPFSMVASALGARWVLLANVVLNGLVIAFAASLLVMWPRSSRRPSDLALALGVCVVCVFAFNDFPAQTADLVVPLDEDAIDFSGWGPHSENSRLLRLADGRQVEFANFVGVEYSSAAPGHYVLVRGHFSRLVLDMRPVDRP